MKVIPVLTMSVPDEGYSSLLTTGQMTLSGTNSPPAEVSTSDRNTDYWADDTLWD
jgi:hypothetical protein